MKRTKIKSLHKAKPIRQGSQDPRSMALSTMRQGQDPQKDFLHPPIDKGWGKEQSSGMMTPYQGG